MKKRCEWAKTEPNTTYHDEEWGVPQHNDKKLFEFLTLVLIIFFINVPISVWISFCIF